MFIVTKNIRNISFVLILIGIVATIFAFSTDAHRAWPSLLFNNYFYTKIVLVGKIHFCKLDLPIKYLSIE